MTSIKEIRSLFEDLLARREFVIDRTNKRIIEILGVSFVASKKTIFGKPNDEYISAEIEWYEKQSTNVNELGKIYGKIPHAWEQTANEYGEINSNYGKLIFSNTYYNQFDKAINELIRNPDSRRAQMIYNRPSIWCEYNENGKNDFICTNAQTLYIRNGKMHMVSQMRSNDAWAGYRNDIAWANFVLDYAIAVYNLESKSSFKVTKGEIIWQAMSFHMYEQNFHLINSEWNR